eukprot:INCI16918.2.p1 GENE.INCI16918.2~~INCI16918.2.p1  ORF type:complete len:274 (+),score=36.82 INCI16918.2:3-824(+)
MHERKFEPTLPISGNYHSLVVSSSIRDVSSVHTSMAARQPRQLSVITQHTMGVASLQEGAIEYMMARNIVNGTDDQGPWPLRQLQGSFSFPTWVLVGDAADIEKQRLPTAMFLQHPLAVMRGDPKKSKHLAGQNYRAGRTDALEDYHLRGKGAHSERSIAQQPLEAEVHLLSFHVRQLPEDNEEYVVRLQNVVEGSGIKTVNIAESVLNYETCKEMTLSLQETRATSDANRLAWKIQGGETNSNSKVPQVHSKVDCTKIELGPLDIRTFLVTI